MAARYELKTIEADGTLSAAFSTFTRKADAIRAAKHVAKAGSALGDSHVVVDDARTELEVFRAQFAAAEHAALERKLSTHVIYLDGGVIWSQEIPRGWSADRAIAFVLAGRPSARILNDMPLEEAAKLYGAAA